MVSEFKIQSESGYFSSISTTASLIEATVISCMDFCDRFLTALPYTSFANFVCFAHTHLSV